ncbi:MAG TPA: sulfatase-like hydrolase/transferase [Allosphingosinicella sp.]|nr:sulfatase-like hydrolase/transferase [Allosphingosinicella sp.]
MSRFRPWWAIAFAFFVTLALELGLVERKSVIFGGGFGQSKVIDRAGEWAVFLPGLLVSHAALILVFYLVLRALHGRRAGSALFFLNFLFVAVGLVAALLIAKFQALAYFSDAMGFELVRSLGGGSLFTAALYVLDEATLLGLGAVAAAAAYYVCFRLVRKYAGDWRSGPDPLRWRHLLGLTVLAVPLALVAGSSPDARYGLARFTGFATINMGLRTLTDFDRDGYSWFTAQRDSAPFDPARHPLALDMPGNGVDEDGFGGDFRFSGAPPAEPVLKLPPQPRHLVVIVLESFRGDAIGKVVAGRPVTPNLNALARDGAWVSEAYSHVGFTTESGMSIFGGALAPRRGGPSLFRDLKAAGYRIGVFSAAPEDFGGISETVGMRESADLYVDADLLKAERAHESASLGSLALDGRIVLRELDRHFRSAADWARPTFLYVNIQEAHFPYSHKDMPRFLPGRLATRSEITAANRAMVERTYWNAAAYSDWLVGEVVRRLKAQGVYDRTLILITGDHGEALFEEGFLGHGHVIDRAQTRVPLILSDPALRVTGPVGLADYRGILLRGLSGDPPPPARASVFQYIGTLDRPGVIGIVEPGGVWTSLNLETEELWFSDSGRRLRYRELAAGSPDRARADRLVQEWERQRWLAR